MSSARLCVQIVSFYVFLLSTFFGSITAGTEVIFCTFFTPSHERMAREWMIPSIQDNVPLIIGTGEQKCSSATFYKTGWNDTMRDKVDFILDTTKKYKGAIIVFIDPDIIFFRPVKKRLIELLAHVDFVGQYDSPLKNVCTGFFAMHANDAVIKLWQEVRDLMDKKHDICDQIAFNRVLAKKRKKTFSWAFLPKKEFFGGGTFKHAFWIPGKKLTIPRNPCMFHANFTVFCYKEQMLQYVQDTVIDRKRRSMH